MIRFQITVCVENYVPYSSEDQPDENIGEDAVDQCPSPLSFNENRDNIWEDEIFESALRFFYVEPSNFRHDALCSSFLAGDSSTTASVNTALYFKDNLVNKLVLFMRIVEIKI